MCVAGLNVSTQQCAHRWYELVRPCHPANNLANCPEKLRLEGWETRNGHCPWCDESEAKVPESTHKLFGSTSSASSTSSSPSIPGRRQRSGSEDTLGPLSRHSSVSSTESDRGQRHRDMNDRLHVYLLSDPHEVLPSAKKNYPTYSQTGSRTTVPSISADAPSLKRTSTALSKSWKRSVRVGADMLKF